MSRDSSANYELAALLIRLAMKASLALFYIACLTAVQLTVSLLRAQTAGEERAGSGSDQQAEGVLVGILVTACWGLAATAAFGLATRQHADDAQLRGS